MICLKKYFSILINSLLTASCLAATSPQITQTGSVVTLQNERVRLEFDLAAGTYSLFNQGEAHAAISKAKLKINDWTSDAAGVERTWKQRSVKDTSGKGLALDLRFKSPKAPELLFTFALYEQQDYFSVSGGLVNSTKEIVRIKDIHVLADGVVYDGVDMTKDFAMVDGFSGGEPVEHGPRSYSPLTRANALKSRNNILLTFSEGQQRRALVMGGLTYRDFEKFATIAQKRRTELELGKDGKSSLLCYLDLPADKSDHSPGGETLVLTKGSKLRTWDNHEFHCIETATSVMEQKTIIISARNLQSDRPYTLGFSWWEGYRSGKFPDRLQSVFVEFEKDGVTNKLPLVTNCVLPRFDSRKKQEPEEVELALPAEAVRASSLRITVEKPAVVNTSTNKNARTDETVYLSEIWLRDGRCTPLLPAKLTPLAQCPQPRRQFFAQLFAADPVGKRVDSGQRYMSTDRFYIDVTGRDPFVALENYGHRVQQAQQVELSMYDFPTVCMWYAADKEYGNIGNSHADNTSLGAVEEMQRIAASGFLKYSRAAVRLVPDSYMPNNQQGWWDDAHWQRPDTDCELTKNGRYVAPYETTKKWAGAVTELGGIPLTYFQTSFRSEDYAKEFPGHMLFNKQFAWKKNPVPTNSDVFTDWHKAWQRNGLLWGYDYTDPGFVAHMREVFANLKAGGVRGLMFDYPENGRASGGGMEDDYSTMAAAYRKIFELAHDGLGPNSYVHERNMDFGSDITIGAIASMRTENDTDEMDGTTVTRCGLRWYKNRALLNQDTDSKNLARAQKNPDEVRAILTMMYVVSGRLLLANSFSQFTPETLHDLTRVFPFHAAPKSARPVDAFVSDTPAVYDFEVNPQWHQVTFYNSNKRQQKSVGINFSGPPVSGALGLKLDREYYAFDFWNDRFLGKFKGNARLEQELRPGEALMISLREVLNHPQVISTDRHVMQGYLDLVKEDWNENCQTLTGVSKIVGDDPYTVTLALNGYPVQEIQCTDKQVKVQSSAPKDGLVKFTLTGPKNATVEWFVCCAWK